MPTQRELEGEKDIADGRPAGVVSNSIRSYVTQDQSKKQQQKKNVTTYDTMYNGGDLTILSYFF